ncbi:MAG: CBS domain-containing protein [bacterium]|nr:CBS domain-containing protein [bacterium]
MDFKLNLHSEKIRHAFPDTPLVVQRDISVRKALEVLKANNRGALLVIRDESLVGIFTERDGLKILARGEDLDQPLENVMTREVVCLTENDSVGSAIEKMAKGGYRRMPVVNQTGEPTGIIGVSGILHFIVGHVPQIIYTLPPTPHQSSAKREGA